MIGARVVWGIRQSDVDLDDFGLADRIGFRLSAMLSRYADLIIFNSECGARTYAARGYASERMIVIANGIDTERFRPDAEARIGMRREWGLDAATHVVGSVGRLHPIKDHATFLRAAALVLRKRPDVRFVSVGDGSPDCRARLAALARELGIEHAVMWKANDLRAPAVMNALDVLCSSSIAEGFSNVIAEAMACGTVPVATDVGDTARLVGDCGALALARSPEALAEALLACLSMPDAERRRLGARARQRVLEHFNVGRMVAETWSALETVA